ncbi:copper-binding protein [Pendulispora rubella]|uniref:Copper-binding protein n=1 Tax=Pendulispora rubella TaxID=2741070 RepID=A0ABZ2LBF4_9BACT
MRLFVPRALFVAFLVASASALAHGVRPPVAEACGSETHTARGVVRSFGPERKFVNIAHEKIEGYMMAMTMSFEPRGSGQLEGLAVGDNVAFTFTATEDGRRLIDAITKK